MSVPLLFETKFILKAWLGTVPENTIVFCHLIILNSLVEVFSFPLMTIVQATGIIKCYQIVISLVLLLILPGSYFMLKANYSPTAVLIGMIAVSGIAFMVRIEFARRLAGLSRWLWFSKVFLKVAPVVAITLAGVITICSKMEVGFYRFIMTGLVTLIFSVAAIMATGLDPGERNFIVARIKLRFNPQC